MEENKNKKNNKKRQRKGVDKQTRQKARVEGAAVKEPADDAPSETAPAARPIEVQFARKLAANEPVTRDRAVKKLRRWLTSRAAAASASSSETFGEDEMLRLWKGLYYCFWMSDKPLVQEELAESICSLVRCFASSPSTGLLFVRCFLVTMGREWSGLDRLRTDKFMMLTRRMLRHALLRAFELREAGSVDAFEKFASGFDSSVVSANRDDYRSALGFQLHFVDVFMEEVAKVNSLFEGKDGFETDDVLETLTKPFVVAIVREREGRLKDQIEERIFNHLIRQSDAAIAYEMEEDEEEEEDDDEEEEGGSTTTTFELKSSDPRAGVGDVTLPQLEADYAKVAEFLLRAGSEKGVRKVDRDRLYRMTKRFRMLAEGVYPFAIELDENGALDRDVVDAAAAGENDDVGFNFERAARKSAKASSREMEERRREKLEYKEAMKEKRKKEDARSSVAAAAEPAANGGRRATKKKRGKERAEERIRSFAEKASRKRAAEETSKDETVSAKKKKTAVAEEVKEKQPATFSNKSNDDGDEAKPSKGKKGAVGSGSAAVVEGSAKRKAKGGEAKEAGKAGKKLKKKPFECPEIRTPKGKLPPATFLKKALSQKKEAVKPPALRGKKGKGLTMSEPPRGKSKSAAAAAKGRKLNFAMSKNKYQSLRDIDRSIQESPNIPFDAEKRPSQGVLKASSSAGTTPVSKKAGKQKSVVYNTMMNSQSKFAFNNRMVASDFFD